MAQGITDPVVFLKEAKEAVRNMYELEAQEEQLALEEKRLGKELESEKKAVEDAISITIKRRVDEIHSSYDQQINVGQEKLKKIRIKREKAKNQGVRDRIAEDTAELKEENKELTGRMKMLFHQNRVPAFCNSAWYYSMYFPKGIKELFIFLITMLVLFLGIPCGIYFMIPDKAPWMLVLIYLAVILLFGGGYMTINNNTKVRYRDTLKEGRSIRNIIESNNRKIRVITSTIKKDRDEAVYDLEKYDDEISRLEDELLQIRNKKKEALNTFEKVTRTIISDEISSSSKAKIDNLETGYMKVSCEHDTTEHEIQAKNIEIMDTYGVYVGREYLTQEKLDVLIGLIEDGMANNLSEALIMDKSGTGMV